MGRTADSTAKPNATRWTLIVRAQGMGPDARDALETLLKEYFGFLVFLIRVNRHPPDTTAEDLAQEYVLGVVRRGVGRVGAELERISGSAAREGNAGPLLPS